MNCWHQSYIYFVSVDRGERGSAIRGLYHERSKEVNLFQIDNMDSGNTMQCSWTLMSIRMNHPFHGGKSLPARQEDSKLQILSRLDIHISMYFISITMKFINEVA